MHEAGGGGKGPPSRGGRAGGGGVVALGDTAAAPAPADGTVDIIPPCLFTDIDNAEFIQKGQELPRPCVITAM